MNLGCFSMITHFFRFSDMVCYEHHKNCRLDDITIYMLECLSPSQDQTALCGELA